MENYFEGKVVWITGASSGIGEALAMQLAKKGAKLILSARRQEELERVAKLTELSADRYLILPFDVTEFSRMDQLAQEVNSAFGSIDILINNAGISSRGRVLETDLSVYQKLMDVDFFSTVALTQAVGKFMLQQKQGHIVVVSSLMGKFSTPWRSAYCAAKHALHGFFDALRAEEYKNGLRVTLICPGFVSTKIAFNALNDKGEQRKINDNSNANGMPPTDFARKMLKAISKQKDEVYIGGSELRGIWAKRFAPRLLNKMMRNFKPH